MGYAGIVKSDDDIYQHLGNTIRTWRKEKGLNQAELGEKVGLHQTAIAKIERNERRVDFAVVVRIVEALDIPWEAVVGGEKADPLGKALADYVVQGGRWRELVDKASDQAGRLSSSAVNAMQEMSEEMSPSTDPEGNEPDAVVFRSIGETAKALGKMATYKDDYLVTLENIDLAYHYLAHRKALPSGDE